MTFLLICRDMAASVATWRHTRRSTEARRASNGAPVLQGQPSGGALVRARQSAAIDRSNLPATGSQLPTKLAFAARLRPRGSAALLTRLGRVALSQLVQNGFCVKGRGGRVLAGAQITIDHDMRLPVFGFRINAAVFLERVLHQEGDHVSEPDLLLLGVGE